MKLTLALVLLLAALLGFVLIDDDVDPGPAAWAALAKDYQASENEAFHILFGFVAKESEQPAAVGKELLRIYREQEAAFTGTPGTFQFDGYPENRRLTLPEGDLYCHMHENSCFDTLLSNTSGIKGELDRHAVLLGRYRGFLSYDDFRTLTKPTVYAPTPEYQYLQKGNQLHGLLVLKQVSEGQQQAALHILYSDITRLRRLLENADTLILKMVSASLLANDLDLLANLHAAGYITAAPELARLTLEERSLYLPMIREFAMSANLYRDLDGNPEFFGEGGTAPAWLIRALFKPNMTINSAFPIYDAVHRLSLSPPGDFYEERESLEAFVEAEAEAMYSIRNFGGDMLTRVAMPDFSRFVSRMYDLDCKIKLMNIVLAPGNDYRVLKGAADVNHADIGNPYDNHEVPYIDHQAGKLCFSGPGEDEKAVRCIRIEAQAGRWNSS